MGILRNLKVGQKLLILIATAGLLLLVIGGSGYSYMLSMAKDTKKMYTEQLLTIDSLAKLRSNIKDMNAYMLEAMLSKDKAYSKELVNSIQTLNNANLSKEKPELFPEEVINVETYKSLAEEFSNLREHALELAAENKNQEAYDYYVKEVKTQGKELESALNRIITYHEERAKNVDRENDDKVTTASIIIITVIVAGLVLLAVGGTLISRTITSPLNAIRKMLARAGDGDLTERSSYDSKDEIGQLAVSYNDMAANMKDTLNLVSGNAEMVVASSAQLNASAQQSTEASVHIANTIQELASGSERQLRSVEESTTAIEQISNHAISINDNVTSVTDNAAETAQISADGKKSIDEMIWQMNEISSNVEGLGKTIQALSERSAEIGTINDAITAIADQTNLLALNAAIEAARAGEHGKGFAVVADEVRKLAEQSVQSAEQIASLITTIQTDTKETIQSMETTATGVARGIDVAQTAGSSFESIERAIRNVNGQINDVADSITELTSGTQQVAASISSVKDIAEEAAAISQTVSAGTEEQVASMEEIETSATNLAEISEELQTAVSKFKLN